MMSYPTWIDSSTNTTTCFCHKCGKYYSSYTIHYCYTVPTVPTETIDYDFKIKQVENGYIVEHDGKQYVATTVEQVSKLLKKGEKC